jgi:hypothetical protein
MKAALQGFLVLILSSTVPLACSAQCTTSINTCAQGVPHFVKFNGTLKAGVAGSRGGVVAIKFVIYDASTDGTALWQEVQNTQLDNEGHYEVMLGATATDGMPMDLFTSGLPRWLGVQVVQPGSQEEPRVLMVSVPYALEAADAQTLGGLPSSAFAKATGSVISATSTDAPAASPAAHIGTEGVTPEIVPAPSTNSSAAATFTANTVPKFAANGTLTNSQITDSAGTVTMQDLSNILFADRFTGGVPDAVAACPASGCIIYAVSPGTNLSLGTIDPGNKAITIYLGPYIYNVKQVVLRKAMKIIGMGAAGGTSGSPTCSVAAPCHGTSLQSINGNNPVFVVPQTNNTPVTDVTLSGFRLLGSAGNHSEDAFFLDTSSTINSGLWYSTLDDLYIEGFSGIPIHIKGRNNDFASATQWVLFNNVIVFRTNGGGNGLRMEGAAFELRFRNCEFDGQALGDGTNIYIGGASSGLNGYPIGIVFEGLVTQFAGTAVQIDGAYNVAFYGSHHELLWGGYHVTNNTGIGTHGLTITDSYFSGNVGVNSGAGYELKIDTTFAFGIVFAHNQMFGNPDAAVSGYNLASVAYQDNLYAGILNGPPTSGITSQIDPATAISISGVHSVGLNPSATPITAIQSGLGPGEMVTFYGLGGPITFGAGGNIDLFGAPSITVNGTITFVRTDLGAVLWKPVSQWSPQ